MIANRSQKRRTPFWLVTLLTLVVGGGLMAQPLVAHASDKTVAAEKDSKGKDGKKKKAEGGVPELPNIGYAIGNFAPNSKIGKFFLDHSNWYVLRIAVSFIVVLLFMIFFSKVFKQRSVKPTRIQTLAEMIVEGLDNLCAGVLGKEVSRRYLPFLGSLFLFIVALNFFGMVPLGIAPTAGYQEIAGIRIPTATSALAICTLIVTQYTNFKYNSVKTVFLHWCGNPTDAVTWVIGIIFIPLHIFSDFIIKPLSLLLRLFGNIYGEDVLLGSMLMLGMMIFSFAHTNGVPLAFPLQLPFLFLSLLLGTIQALVFTLLSMIYILMVLPHDDHHDDEHHEEAHAHA